MSDSKSAAIDKIIGELQWRTVNKDGERGAELAKQAILAILAQEVKRELLKAIDSAELDPNYSVHYHEGAAMIKAEIKRKAGLV